jgi:myo-inositol-1(or 4)-monophosphatase
MRLGNWKWCVPEESWGAVRVFLHRRVGATTSSPFSVASGRLDGYYERGIWSWDLAAGSVILEEAGGKLTNYRGGMLDLEGREIVASNGRLHSAMTKLTSEDDQQSV